MEKKIEERLQSLRQEHEKGVELLRERQNEISELQRKLFQISGAIQVLEELLNRPSGPEVADSQNLKLHDPS